MTSRNNRRRYLADVDKTKQNIHTVDWLVVFNVLSQRDHLETAPPFTVPCEGREAQFLHRTHRELNPGSLRGSPLPNRCATPAPLHTVEYK